MKRWLTWAAAIVAVPLFLESAPRAQAQVLVVTAKSVETLVGDLEYLAREVAPDEESREAALQSISMLKSPQLLVGLDRSKPIGVWVTLPQDPQSDGAPAVLAALPVTDLKAFIANIRNFGVEARDRTSFPGFAYQVTIPGVPMPFYVAEGNGYAYLSLTPQNAEKLTALTPADWVPTREGVGDLSISLRLDQIPAQFKDLALGQLEQQLSLERQRKPGEDEATYQGRLAGMKLAEEGMKQFVRESKDLNLDLIVDQKVGTVAVDMSLAGMPNTGMARSLAGFASRSSRYQSLNDATSAVSAWANIPLSAELRAAVAKSGDEGFRKALADAKNATEKEFIQRAKAILDEIAAAESFDAGASIRSVSTPGSETKQVVVLGLNVPDAKKVEDLLRDALKQNPPSPNDAKVTLDAATAPDGTKLHRIDPVDKPVDPSLKSIGDPIVHLAFRKNQILAAVGSDSEAGLVKALGDTSRPDASSEAPPVAVRLAVDKLASMMPSPDPTQVSSEAAKVFAGDRAARNQIALTLGSAPAGGVRLRLSLDVPAVAFLTRLGMAGYQSAAAAR